MSLDAKTFFVSVEEEYGTGGLKARVRWNDPNGTRYRIEYTFTRVEMVSIDKHDWPKYILDVLKHKCAEHYNAARDTMVVTKSGIYLNVRDETGG
jgi:hypothetical protein